MFQKTNFVKEMGAQDGLFARINDERKPDGCCLYEGVFSQLWPGELFEQIQKDTEGNPHKLRRGVTEGNE